eukprot:1856094-Prymnesium_polylepis.1
MQLLDAHGLQIDRQRFEHRPQRLPWPGLSHFLPRTCPRTRFGEARGMASGLGWPKADDVARGGIGSLRAPC